MILGIAKIIGTEILKTIVNATVKKIKPEMFSFEKDEMTKFKGNFQKHYGNHFKEICNWSNSIPFIGLAKPKETHNSTIELIIASDIIRYEQNTQDKVNESEILESKQHVLLVGAPGAGKTTTLKRLILKYFNDFSTIEEPGYPVLVRLRDIPTESTLFKFILDIFSISYQDNLIKSEKKRKKNDLETNETYYEEYIEEKVATFVGKTPINNFIANFLNESNCMLILDGIDELNKSTQLNTFREIEQLGL